MDANEMSYFVRAALLGMAALAGYLLACGLRFSRLETVAVLIGLLPGIGLVVAFAVVRISDGSLAGGYGLAALVLIGFSITAGILLATGLINRPVPRRRPGDAG